MFSLDEIHAAIEGLQIPKPLPEMPKLVVPTGGGVPGVQRVVVCVPVTYWKGKPSGAYADLKQAFHRLEVKRLVSLDEFSVDPDNVLAWFQAKLGAKAHDDSRPDIRTSLVMHTIPPAGIPNRAPWGKAYRAIKDAIVWAHQAVSRYHAHQYALLLAADLTEWTQRDYSNGTLREAEITALLKLQVVRLQGDVTRLAPIATALSSDDDDVAHLAE